ncbi:hypothetical protein NI389_12495 [Pseudoalteromonas xiamenensis]|uniref:hypothetical protein n=1 Tax=Pseudoalteromonas xiamenensis TaxID=882626 RepID=UPI0027E535CD|nr:hypothetical protein [Pseudoalteromonas xiamenensis]WMN59032.1 hypothetical protein NI389_12495 [Pseudoalteromonas xiamenensis]
MELNQAELLELEKQLVMLRVEADLTLLPNLPYFSGKPYPLGRCKEIRDEVYTRFVKALESNTSAPFQKINAYLKQGGVIEKAWGSLRDEYFQNAMIIGKWYVDVSNDTVYPNKPRVEIVELEKANFYPITTFEKFSEIAKKYWEVEVYANTVLPALAPYFPLICVNKKGISWLAAANDNMVAVAMNSQFQLSEQVLRQTPNPPEQVVKSWQSMLNQINQTSAFLSQQGCPETYCEQYRSQNAFTDLNHRNSAVLSFQALPNSVKVPV